ncbi:hypothetical protein CEXT_481681 [Caerostris extrusa]|uniref:Uncharacterized protein n=1 Tax=Caerostris extrusa TaxID=172846 RepID=A0AAV4R2P4_CAEEX|nr:hypothetical protein CEXT_481681 [Caerostris extrusa]
MPDHQSSSAASGSTLKGQNGRKVSQGFRQLSKWKEVLAVLPRHRKACKRNSRIKRLSNEFRGCRIINPAQMPSGPTLKGQNGWKVSQGFPAAKQMKGSPSGLRELRKMIATEIRMNKEFYWIL